MYHPNLVDVTTGLYEMVSVCHSVALLSLAKLFDRLKDSDEKVRLEAVKTVCEVASESLATVPVKVTSIDFYSILCNSFFLFCTAC